MIGGALWDWSLARYEGDGVAERLVALQDEGGLDVCVLLWCVWAGEYYGDLPDEVLAKGAVLCGRWSSAATASLRATRRALKTPPPEASAAETERLRTSVKDAELAAEKIALDMLENSTEGRRRTQKDAANALASAERNLVKYVAIAGGAVSVDLLEDIARRLMNGGPR